MRQDLNANTSCADLEVGPRRPDGTCRELGLAAVAAELRLQIDELEYETAKAVERGAAALFLAGVAPASAKTPLRARPNPFGHGRKARRQASESSRAVRSRVEKPATIVG
jgi:hypothetical protein